MLYMLGNNAELKQAIICFNSKQYRADLKHLEVISLQSIKKECAEITVCTASSFLVLGGKTLRNPKESMSQLGLECS